MMKKINIFLALLALVGVWYFLIPSPELPDPPGDSLVSHEPADTESPYRKAYYTNLKREEIMSYYKKVFYSPGQIRLNLPPEDAQIVIRDQTRSNFLEELVHPGKEVLYVNGFYPDKPQDQIIRNDKIYIGKITVRMVPTHPITRLTGWGLTLLSIYLLIRLIRRHA
jgi:hypothetical protein